MLGRLAAADRQEISDRIVSFDPQTLERLPVRKQPLVEKFLEEGNPYAARVVAGLPARGDRLDDDAVDRLLIRIHCELQRLSEEFEHGKRLLSLLRPLIRTLQETGLSAPIRVVDIGCGIGYIVRWLAAYAGFGSEVKLIGADYHPALISEAQRLAELEHLRCTFQVANAFRLTDPAALFLSTGVVHHFRRPYLAEFFRQHDAPATQGFLHFDFQPTPLSWPGAWLFHQTRMREPLSRHDGILSALRAHSGQDLLAAVRQGAPAFSRALLNTHLGSLPIPRVFHTIAGVRPELAQPFSRLAGKEPTCWETGP
jgi:SAM-dependent methyltransferase